MQHIPNRKKQICKNTKMQLTKYKKNYKRKSNSIVKVNKLLNNFKILQHKKHIKSKNIEKLYKMWK